VLDNNRTDVSCRNLAKTYKLLKDDENSQKYLTKSCILGNEKSCYDSAINHYNGVGIIKDEKKAKELMKKVCTSNFKDSCELVNETQDEK
jgi:TPR repeat protein